MHLKLTYMLRERNTCANYMKLGKIQGELSKRAKVSTTELVVLLKVDT